MTKRIPSRNRALCHRSMLCLAVAASLLAAPVWAGEDGKGQGRGRGPNNQARLARLAERLDLSDEQRAEIRPIVNDNAKELRALRERIRSPEGDRMAVRAEIDAIRDRFSERIEAELTDAQIAEYRKLKQERRAERGGGWGNRAP